LSSAAALTRLDLSQKIDFLVDIWPAIQPDTANQAELMRQMLKRRHQGGRTFAFRMWLERQLSDSWKEIDAVVAEMLRDAHADELNEPLRNGLLRLDLFPESASGAAMVSTFVERLREFMSDPRSYPLFDDATGGLVRAGQQEGLFALTDSLVQRATHAGLSSGLVSRLPAFPAASMGQVLDARAYLEPHVARFRKAVADMRTRIASGAFDETFRDEVADLYVREVEAAMEGIASALKRPSLAHLMMKGASAATPPGARSLAMLNVLHLPAVVSIAISATGAIVTGGVALADEAGKRQAEAAKHDLFFLYRANQMLR
jgi:hypothetical protein